MTYKCIDSSYISSHFLCDGIQDCKTNEDETKDACQNLTSPSQLCNDLDNNDLDFYTAVCPYDAKRIPNTETPRLPENYHCMFIPGKSSGLHLAECEHFVCNHTYFKCPGFYCIPWQYVCNTRIDCPGALDERQCDIGSCLYPSQFKCRNSTICVALEDICNGVIDCPLRDDEFHCLTSLKHCPHTCTCLLFVVHCPFWDMLAFENPPFDHRLSFVKISINTNARLNNIIKILNLFNLSLAVDFTLQNGNMSDLN